MRKRRIAYVLAVVMLLCVIIPTAALAASNPYKPLAGLKISTTPICLSPTPGGIRLQRNLVRRF